jgi:predicted Zn-dependent protease
LHQEVRMQTAAAKYGLALIELKNGNPAKAQALLQDARNAAARLPTASSGARDGSRSAILSSLAIDIKVAARRPAEALKEVDAARVQFPLSRGIARQYADALIAAGQYDEAVNYLRDQIQIYRQEPQLQDRLAKSYAAQGKQALQHLALAESYALSGKLQIALDQLSIARRAPDASFYDQSVIDAREREFQTRRREELKEGQKER